MGDSILLYFPTIGWWQTISDLQPQLNGMSGFTLVNFEHLLPFSTESFAFVTHVNQAFFYRKH